TVPPYPGESLAAAVGTAGDHLRWDGRPLSHRLYHFLHRLYGVPGVIGAAGSTLEEPVIPLDLRHVILRIELDKLGVLIGGQHEEILALQRGIHVEIGLPYRRGLGRV